VLGQSSLICKLFVFVTKMYIPLVLLQAFLRDETGICMGNFLRNNYIVYMS
jgi:hypothetical protein